MNSPLASPDKAADTDLACRTFDWRPASADAASLTDQRVRAAALKALEDKDGIQQIPPGGELIAPYLDTLASSIAAARAQGILGNGPFRYGWLSSWIMKSQEPPPKRKFKAAKVNTPPPDVDAAKALADYLRMGARLTELIQKADGLDLARAKTPWPFKWTKMPLGALLTHMTTHDRRHLWQAEQVRNDPNFPIV